MFGRFCLSVMRLLAITPHDQLVAIKLSITFLLFPSDDVWFNGLIGLSISFDWFILFVSIFSPKNNCYFRWEVWGSAVDTLFGKIWGWQRRQSIFVFKGLWSFYYQEEGEDQVLFGFQMKFNKCFVLADPIGQREKWTAATLGVWHRSWFVRLSISFYRISEEYVYESSRLRLWILWKLGN